MAEYFFDGADAGDGSSYIDSAGDYSPQPRTFYFNSSVHGDGSNYFDSLLAPPVGGAVFYYLNALQM